jgi:transcriptional regulator with XRE-family HTH domain
MNKELTALGGAIRRARKTRNISQMNLGEICGLHRTYICDVERGARNVTFLSLMKLARALGATVSDIIRDAEAIEPLPLETNNGNCTASNGSSASHAALGNSASFSGHPFAG